MVKDNMDGLEYVKIDNKIISIILRTEFKNNDINFFTPNDFSQQLGIMNRPKGYIIPPHIHNLVPREVNYTKEVLFIKSGKVRVDFYNESKEYFESRILRKGDIILLAFGGHGFEMIEQSEIIEIKQGPYSGETDKTRFNPVFGDKIKIRD